MSGDKQEYDLVCSLGGNCASAHNLQFRKLREYALPFDWTYFTTDEAVYRLAEGFKNEFSGYMKKQDLKELPVYRAHSDRVPYEDLYGKMVWANHFNKSINDDNGKEYKIIKKTYDKRFKRLVNLVKRAKRVLFLFSTNYETDIKTYTDFSNVLKELYPDKEIEIKVVSFVCKDDEIIKQDNVELYKYKRGRNNYDFYETNFEWSFLDNIKIKEKKQIVKLHIFKKWIIISLLPFIRTLLYFKFYLFGYRLHFYLGEKRDE